MLTKLEKELGFLLKSRGVERDSCIAVLIMLKTEVKYKKMIRWINKHPNAGQYEILGELDVFKRAAARKAAPIPAPQSPTPTAKRARKIAVL